MPGSGSTPIPPRRPRTCPVSHLSSPAGRECGVWLARRVPRRPAEGAPPGEAPGLSRGPDPAPDPDPDPVRTSRPGPAGTEGTAPAGRGQAGARGGGGRAAESRAPCKSNAFVPPVGPAPALHEPGGRRAAAWDRPAACPGAKSGAPRRPARIKCQVTVPTCKGVREML